MKIQRMVVTGLTLLATGFASGCGGGNNTTQITQAQAQAITSDLFEAMASAPLIAGGIAQSVHAPDVAARIRSANLAGAAAAAAGPELPLPATAPITIAIPAFTFNCPAGGTIVVSGSFTGTDNETATPPTLNVTENILETISHCNDNGTIFNGNPNITITGTIALAGNVFTDVTTIAGGVTVGNTNCPINVSLAVTVNNSTNAVSGTVSGSACGVSLNGKL